MITCTNINYRKSADNICDASLGNMMFKIAGIIGIATKNGYTFGFPQWINQSFFVNPLPPAVGSFKKKKIPGTILDIDFGFNGFDYPDNIDLNGEFGSWKYFQHCDDFVRHYFTLKPQCDPYKDTILVHYRDYGLPGWHDLTDYYKKAIRKLPKKRVIVITDNIDTAFKATGLDCEYTSNSPIMDLYLLTQADYLVMGNSTFSWWGAYLSKAKTVAPKSWYAGPLKGAPTKDLYLPNWILV